MAVQHIESNTQRTVVVTGAQGVSGAAVLKRYAPCRERRCTECPADQ